MSYSDEVLADGPSAYWRFDDLTDSSVNSNTLALTGTVPSATGLIATDSSVARSFTNNSANRYEVADHATVDLGDNFTIECWVTVTSLPSAGAFRCISFKDGDTPFIGIDDTGEFICLIGAVEFIRSATTVTLGIPYHLVITKNGNASALYLNGQDDTGVQTPGTVGLSNIANVRIGRGVSPAYPWDGLIDELAFYQFVLSQARVEAHYEAATSTGFDLGYQRIVGPEQFATSAATLYTVPDGAMVRIRKVYVNNPTGGEIEFTLSVGTDAAGTRLLDQHAVAAGESYSGRRATDHALAAGETIQGFADSASAVVVIDAYLEEL